MKTYHKSVLPKETIEALNLKPNGLYIDATFGGGGHTKAILDAQPTCKVIALDWDKTAIEKNGPPIEQKYGNRIKIIWANFARLTLIMKKEKIPNVDGILADFGTSQHQIHHKKGFSFQTNTPLDMRMSPAHQKITAELILNTFSEKEIATILFELGEERKSRKIAKKIIENRKIKPFKTTKQLAQLIEEITPAKVRFSSKTHPATRTFQALRIYVNKELENIKIFLKAAINALKPEGRLACISFHSLEDRIVKTTFKENETSINILTKKPITPTTEEIDLNPSSRSSKMRVAEKKHPNIL